MKKEAKKKYYDQVSRCRKRGIEMRFTFEEWWAWWQVDDRWARRGRGKDRLAMCRFEDEGPYAPHNVYCATNSQNGRDYSLRDIRRLVTFVAKGAGCYDDEFSEVAE